VPATCGAGNWTRYARPTGKSSAAAGGEGLKQSREMFHVEQSSAQDGCRNCSTWNIPGATGTSYNGPTYYLRVIF
jgi:hypothetical protein